MNGFSRSVKDAFYSASRSILQIVGTGLVLVLWFYIIGIGDGGFMGALVSLPTYIMLYGFMVLMISGAMFPVIELKAKLSMGCTRKHAGLGNMLTSLIITISLTIVMGLIFLFTSKEGSSFGTGNVIMLVNVFLLGSSVGAAAGIMVDRFGKAAYYVVTCVLCLGIGGMTAIVMADDGLMDKVGAAMNFLKSPVSLLIFVALFVVAHGLFTKYVAKVDVKL